jgi:hypothetical protein
MKMLRNTYPNKKIRVVYGASASKDATSCLKGLAEYSD